MAALPRLSTRFSGIRFWTCERGQVCAIDANGVARYMPNPRDIVIVGGGHNGLVAAFYLAKAGFKPLVLERRNQVGGAAITEEFHPGFRSSVLAHSAGPLRPEVMRDMQLEKHGLRLITPAVDVTALSPDGQALVLYRDVAKAAQEIAKMSQSDAAK